MGDFVACIKQVFNRIINSFGGAGNRYNATHKLYETRRPISVYDSSWPSVCTDDLR